MGDSGGLPMGFSTGSRKLGGRYCANMGLRGPVEACPPSTQGASLYRISEPHIGTAATSQFPQTRREAHWEATTIPPKSLLTLSYVSPQPLHRVPPRVEVPPEHVQQCVTYLPPQGRVLQTTLSANDRLDGGTLYTRGVAVKTR